MNIDQYNRLQPRIVDLQRAALEFAELGLTKVSRHILAAVFTAQKIKPTKPAPADSSADATPASSPKKGKGA